VTQVIVGTVVREHSRIAGTFTEDAWRQPTTA
jgi:hypothetical protein